MPLGLEPLQEPSTANFHCLLSLILVGKLARDQQSRYLWGEEGCASERKLLLIILPILLEL